MANAKCRRTVAQLFNLNDCSFNCGGHQTYEGRKFLKPRRYHDQCILIKNIHTLRNIKADVGKFMERIYKSIAICELYKVL